MPKKYKKYIWLLLIVFVLFLAPRPAHAIFDWACPDILCHPMATATNLIGTWFINIGSLFGMVLSLAVSWILTYGQGIVNSPPVQAGFGVTLSIANLGFVLAIIIIAIATILRLERYGIKALLAKVIIAAVLVNFGLVLSGVVLNFSDSVSNYFLQGVTGASNGDASIMAFRDKMFNAFQPQKFLNPTIASSSITSAAKELVGYSSAGSDLPAQNLFMSMLMSIIGIVLIIIALATFVIMLVIRYVTLVILLVLLPLAWMASVFPFMSKHFSTWLSKFIEQLLFPPVALFFLWLALTVSSKTIALSTADSLVSAVGRNGLIAAIIAPLFNVTVLTGLILGGLMAAKTMGAAGADIGLGWAKGTGKWAKGKVGRRAAGVGAGILRAPMLQKFSQNLQKVGGGRGPGALLARMTGTAFLAEKVGRGMDTGARGGELNYKYYADRASKLNDEQLKNRIPQSRGAELAGLLATAKDRKGVQVSELVEKIPKSERLKQEDWTRYGKTEGFKDVKGAVGTEAMQDAREKMKKTEGKDPKAYAEATASFTAATHEFVKGMERDEAAKFDWKYMLGLEGEANVKASNLMIRKLAELHPDYVGSASSKLKSGNKERMTNEASGYYADLISTAESEKFDMVKRGGLASPDATNKINERIDSLTKQKDRIDKSIDNVAFMRDLSAAVKAETTATPAAAPAVPSAPAAPAAAAAPPKS